MTAILTVPQGDRLHSLLCKLETEVATASRQARRRTLWQSAKGYCRSERMLADLLDPDCLRAALADGRDPATTWRVLRGLCRHIRFNKRSPFGSLARLVRCEMLAAGEVRILGEQKMACREQQFLDRFYKDIRSAAR